MKFKKNKYLDKYGGPYPSLDAWSIRIEKEDEDVFFNLNEFSANKSAATYIN